MPLYFKLSWFGLDIIVHLISFHISSKWFFYGWIDFGLELYKTYHEYKVLLWNL